MNKTRQLLATLRRLEKSWPKGYWLYAANGTLNLMREHPDGTRNIPGKEGIDPSLSVATFPGIQCDGGDW